MAVQADKKSGKKKDAHGMKYLCVLVALVAIGFGAYWQQETIKDYASVLVQDKTSDQGKLPSRYESDLVTMQVRHLVSDLECEADFMPEVLSKDGFIHVKDAMASPPKDDSSVFFMLNGRNEGVYVSWNGDFDCIGLSSKLAAKWLGADQDVMANGVRLYSQMGHPIRSAEDLVSSKRLVHILLDFQLWQWPGIEKGYKYHLEDGVIMTTVGMRPKVFDVEFFLTQEEADEIIARGSADLVRSGQDVTGDTYSDSRTSYTAFLHHSDFVHDFQARSAWVARLPSASHTEGLQLVRYEVGQLYRKHLDTFHSRDFLPKGSNQYSMNDYIVWTMHAQDTLAKLDESSIPERFRKGRELYPDGDAHSRFPNALLHHFLNDANRTNTLLASNDNGWAMKLRQRLETNESKLMNYVTDSRPHYLPLIVRAWEDRLGLPELHYTFPKHRPNGVSQFFHWIQWAKDKVADLADQAPEVARPGAHLYPSFTVLFQRKMMIQMLTTYSKSLFLEFVNERAYVLMLMHTFRPDGDKLTMLRVLQKYPDLAELAIKAWEGEVAHDKLRYNVPKYVKHYHPQRYATLFLYLNNQTKSGGETVFPHSLDRFSNTTVERDGMSECSSGLAVPPRGLHASLFYHQTPEGDVDRMSLHGGCPPEEGIKWGANAFMWDAEWEEAVDLWTNQ